MCTVYPHADLSLSASNADPGDKNTYLREPTHTLFAFFVNIEVTCTLNNQHEQRST